jgi:hypothetical protein
MVPWDGTQHCAPAAPALPAGDPFLQRKGVRALRRSGDLGCRGPAAWLFWNGRMGLWSKYVGIYYTDGWVGAER